jgi:predicted transcriptional regulator
MSQRLSRAVSELETIDTDEALEALQDERRRAVIRSLRTVDGSLTLEELAAEIDRRDVAFAETVHSTVVDLHHRVLPQLARLGFVSYDTNTRVVEPRESLQELLPLLEELLPLLDHAEQAGGREGRDRRDDGPDDTP